MPQLLPHAITLLPQLSAAVNTGNLCDSVKSNNIWHFLSFPGQSQHTTHVSDHDMKQIMKSALKLFDIRGNMLFFPHRGEVRCLCLARSIWWSLLHLSKTLTATQTPLKSFFETLDRKSLCVIKCKPTCHRLNFHLTYKTVVCVSPEKKYLLCHLILVQKAKGHLFTYTLEKHTAMWRHSLKFRLTSPMTMQLVSLESNHVKQILDAMIHRESGYIFAHFLHHYDLCTNMRTFSHMMC